MALLRPFAFPEGAFAVGGLQCRLAFAEGSGPHLPLAARTGDLDAGALEAFAGFRAFAYGYPRDYPKQLKTFHQID